MKRPQSAGRSRALAGSTGSLQSLRTGVKDSPLRKSSLRTCVCDVPQFSGLFRAAAAGHRGRDSGLLRSHGSVVTVVAVVAVGVHGGSSETLPVDQQQQMGARRSSVQSATLSRRTSTDSAHALPKTPSRSSLGASGRGDESARASVSFASQPIIHEITRSAKKIPQARVSTRPKGVLEVRLPHTPGSGQRREEEEKAFAQARLVGNGSPRQDSRVKLEEKRKLQEALAVAQNDAAELQRMGYHEDAVKRRRDIVGLLQAVHGHGSVQVVGALYELGLACYDAGHARESADHLRAAWELGREVVAQDQPELQASILLAMGNAYVALVCPPQVARDWSCANAGG